MIPIKGKKKILKKNDKIQKYFFYNVATSLVYSSSNLDLTNKKWPFF